MEQFGKYQMVRRVGAGGMAEVFLASIAVAQGLNKQLVIKKIHPAYARSDQFLSMFVDEAKIALSLNHPNIVQVFDFGQVGQTFFLAMEYIEGVDLLRVLQETTRANKRVPLDIAAYIVQQVAKGLDYAHRKTDQYGDPLGIVHRDISPQNVLVSWDGAVKIVDFGIARAAGIKEEEGVIKGKYAYMAPEHARGMPVDRRADVFATGVLLFELVCGRPLFLGRGKEVLEQAKAGAIPSPRKLNPDIPKDLEATILKALTFDRDSRFQTTRDLQRALGQFQFEWAQSHGGIPSDSGTLAQWLARNIPKTDRPAMRRPSTTPGTPSAIGSATQATKGTRALGTNAVHDEISTHSGGLGTPSPETPLPERKEVRERKPAFILEGALAGLEALTKRVGAEAAEGIVADFYSVAKDIAFKHDALLEETEDAGLRAIVGVPAAGDDDASKTTRLALALIEALDGIGHDVEPELRLAVGIERGTAVVTRDKTGAYTHTLEDAPGQSAAALARDARGAEILVTSEVYRVAQDDWNFETLSGTGEGRLYRLRGPKERQQRLRERSEEVELLGRDLELKALRDSYREVLIHGAHRFFVITGEPGMGKRSLINTVLAGLPKGEATVMRAAARPATRYTPFGVIADFARDAMGLAEGAEPKEIRRRIEMLAGVLWPNRQDTVEIRELVDAVCMIFGIRRDDSPTLDADELHSRLREVALRLEEMFSPDRPLIVIAENVHWADEQTIALTLELMSVKNTRGVLVLITSRADANVLQLAQAGKAAVMPLAELDERTREQLIVGKFVEGEDVRDLVKQILPHTGGNPYFIREVMDSLVERGILTADPKGSASEGLLRWSRSDAPIQIPTTVEALLATRIDQLDEHLKLTLLHASVLGSRFRPQELANLLGDNVDQDLVKLVERGLLRKESSGHSFANDMTTTVAYRMVPADDRRVLHRRAASNFKNSPRYSAGQDDAYIARHLELAGELAEAAQTYVNAATHAIHVGSMGDALYQLGRGLSLLDPKDHRKRLLVHLKREEVLSRLARRTQQRAEIDALRAEAEEFKDPQYLAAAHARLTQYNIDVGKLDAAAKSVEPALRYARDARDQLAEAEALRLQSSIMRLQGHSEEALKTNDQALAIVERQADALDERAQILNARGTILWNMNRLTQAIESYAETLVIYKNLRQPRQEARALNNMGIVFSALGESEAALGHYKRSLRIDQRLGDRAQIALKLGNIGQTYTEIGDDIRGEKYLLKALKLSEAHQDWTAMLDIVNSLGQAYLNRRDLERAREYLERGLELAIESHNHYQEIRSLVYLALTRIEQNDDIAEARSLAERATAMAKKVPMPVGEMFGLAAQALACHATEEFSHGLKLSTEALGYLENIEQGEGLEIILHIHSRLCESNQRIDEARETIQRSRDEVDRKAAKIKDGELRNCYLSGNAIVAIYKDHARLVGTKKA
jgi:serine/threonine protein kinase/predicted ATPase